MRLLLRGLECGKEILKAILHADMVEYHAFDNHARHFLTGLNHESLLGKKTGLVTIALGIIQFVLVKGGCIDYIPRMSVPTVRLTETRCQLEKTLSSVNSIT